MKQRTKCIQCKRVSKLLICKVCEKTDKKNRNRHRTPKVIWLDVSKCNHLTSLCIGDMPATEWKYWAEWHVKKNKQVWAKYKLVSLTKGK